ncbi:dihydropyrimidinase [Thermovirga sp.]|uniref:dihydropyrimidinase n=1 Tax=Thermovirga sp. TaxID=2699834 RepID=UPI0025E7A0FE|nr:dihydropyrimidinase [Thermovirga sp.]MBO8153812.1 dihydropyrimidinase [Thermovirga sp.]
MYDLVIKGGTLVLGEKTLLADLAIAGSRIAAIGEGLEGKRVIDAEDMLVLPGGIDMHTHMALPVGGTRSSDDFYSGTVAAAFGGITTIADFTVGSPETSLKKDLTDRLEDAKESVLDYVLHSEIVGWRKSRIDEIREVSEDGVRTFKFFMAYGDSGRRTSGGQMLEAFREISSVGGIALVHAEDEDIISYLEEGLSEDQSGEMKSLALTRPDVCEATAVAKAAIIAGYTECRLHVVHLSSAMGLREVRKARELGIKITTETCPQYLLLTEDAYDLLEGHLFSASPSLKKPLDCSSLWEGLANGSIDVVATDHCPFTRAQKAWKGSFRELPYGLPGVETSRALLFSEGVKKGKIKLSDFVRVTSTAPAKLLGLYPRKGTLMPGADGDVVVFDPEKEWVISADSLHMNVDFSPFEGLKVKGKVAYTISRGEVIIEEREFTGEKGRGRFLGRKV